MVNDFSGIIDPCNENKLGKDKSMGMNTLLLIQKVLNVVAVILVFLIIDSIIKRIKKIRAEWRAVRKILDIRLVPYNKVRVDDAYKDVVPDSPDMIPDSRLVFFVIMVWTAITSKGFSLSVPTVYNKETDQYIVVKCFYRYVFFSDIIKTKRIPVVVLKSKEEYWEKDLQKYHDEQEY